MQQRIVRFYGDVQGVGFRFTACRLADRYDVCGYVKNMPDGSVECVIEGPDEEIEAFVADIVEQMGGHIRRHTRQDAKYTGRFSSFSVKF